jgi:hypothetical protein
VPARKNVASELTYLLSIADTRNAFHGSDSPASARHELGLVFEGELGCHRAATTVVLSTSRSGYDIDWAVKQHEKTLS